MNSRMLWSRILKVAGGIAILVGTLDPLEGSLLILPGSGMVALESSNLQSRCDQVKFRFLAPQLSLSSRSRILELARRGRGLGEKHDAVHAAEDWDGSEARLAS